MLAIPSAKAKQNQSHNTTSHGRRPYKCPPNGHHLESYLLFAVIFELLPLKHSERASIFLRLTHSPSATPRRYGLDDHQCKEVNKIKNVELQT